jgi:thiol-disulfide isomerase/thioredoxin
MSKQPLVDIPYLEDPDVNSDGSIKPEVTSGKFAMVMVQGNFCHFCNEAKPDFQKFAQNNSKVSCLTVQIDGGTSDKQAADKLNKHGGKGVPSYLVFSSDGKFMKQYTGGRDVASLQKFANSL